MIVIDYYVLNTVESTVIFSNNNMLHCPLLLAFSSVVKHAHDPCQIPAVLIENGYVALYLDGRFAIVDGLFVDFNFADSCGSVVA